MTRRAVTSQADAPSRTVPGTSARSTASNPAAVRTRRTWSGADSPKGPGAFPGGSRRNLDWVRPHADLGAVPEDTALLLADAQTSGGLLLGGEIPGAPVIGEFVPRRDAVVIVR